jgi:hypothetical protein
MKCVLSLGISFLGLTLSAVVALGQAEPLATVVQARLIEPGSTPFYLQAVITERGDPTEHVDVEMFWAGPEKWRRIIKSAEFSQTLIVNGDKISEQDSADYMPLAIQVLTTAMVDPEPVLAAVRPGDMVRTKANGLSDESGRTCSPDGKMCGMGRFGLMESLGGAGRSVDFMDYKKFKDRRVARMISYRIDPGDTWQARITTLAEFKSNDEAQFAITNPTPTDMQIHSVVLSEVGLRNLSAEPVQIIWPQVLEDQNMTGKTSYYVSLDRGGKIREVLPLSVAIERADDSARRQIMRQKFNPAMKGGIPVQAEGILSFNYDTRAYGPKAMLTDEEARKLAADIVDPEFPPGTASGTTCSIRIAVDADGHVIEQIAMADCHGIHMACQKAIGKWHFSPIMEAEKPRPYRAELTFRVP